MSGIYTQNNSPYYWLRYYNKFEEDPKKKRKSLNTKIPVTEADKKRIKLAKTKDEKAELIGTPELKKLKREFEQGLAEWAIKMNTGIELIKTLTFSEGFEEYKKDKTIPGRKGSIKQSTISNYTIAVDHMLKCCSNKLIYKYKESDYNQLLFHFESIGLSINSRSIYSKALHSVWKFFEIKHYARKNIIDIVEPEEKDPNPIPLGTMAIIIKYLKENENKHHYQIIYFMLLTGCRPSSAIEQLKEDIDFLSKQITINNIKTGARKGKKFYRFPLYPELERFLYEEMGVVQGNKGRLFEQFSVVPEHYTWPLTFWKRAINYLHKNEIIPEKYTLKQIRPTFATFLINVLGIDIYDVQKLLDHTNIKITDKHYVSYNTQRIRKDMFAITSGSLLNAK
ncbi:MAG: tyrosine-type recombinase/integrase [Bacteroidetes bacterium]|nr:tyrosine-type recombinase/integrase [Bacteroidota bacterium]MBU1114194.1 tyrosine-type recombinase/integrase [Bacteroidota bacterium]MBU1797004.1 tyrosine-type recombinase/integrase [Bacteroidota bacterium]